MGRTVTTFRQRVGCWLHERWRCELALRKHFARILGIPWTKVCNRNEILTKTDYGTVCQWKNSSFLTVSRIFPAVGGKLCKTCFCDFPVCFSEAIPRSADTPEISVIFPVGGSTRLAQFKTVLKSFMGQRHDAFEIIVVEYSNEPEYKSHIPSGVRYEFLPQSSDDFNKSLAMNVGVRLAKAPYVLLHDADIVVPGDYIRQICHAFRQGYEAVRPMRFIFHLNQRQSRTFQESGTLPVCVDQIQQNNPGISTAVRKDIYWEIGGHDERFVGWGGEDVEFLDRLQTIRLCHGEWMPVIHLWHPAAPKKENADRNARTYALVTQEDRLVRIQACRSQLSRRGT